MLHTYTPGKTKGYIRNEVSLHLSSCNHILTLPNLYFNLEKEFLSKGIKVDCTEVREDIYIKQKEIAPKGVTLFNKDIQNVEVDKYDGVFLDMCGPFTESLSITIQKLKPNTEIVLTLLLARECNNLQRFIDINNREESYVKLLNKHGVDVNFYVNYTDTTPMCVFFGTKI